MAQNWPPTSLLGGLGPAARERLLALGTQVSYPPGRMLMREGDDTAFVVILTEGVAKATATAPAGREALLAIRMGGDLAGELAALDGRPRSATVVTCGPVEARVATGPDFVGLLRREPAIAQAVSASVAAKLRAANSFRIDFTGCDAETRLARVIHQIGAVYGEPIGEAAIQIRWPINQLELAALSGTSEPTVQRALRRLREAAVVTTGYRSITILDLARLSQIAFERMD